MKLLLSLLLLAIPLAIPGGSASPSATKQEIICVNIVPAVEEKISFPEFKKYISTNELEPATEYAMQAWNFATKWHYHWIIKDNSKCQKRFHVVVPTLDSSWPKILEKFNPGSDAVGFTAFAGDDIWIFIHPETSRDYYRNLAVVMTHEFGHALGLDHVDDKQDIMVRSFKFNFQHRACLGGCLKIGPQSLAQVKKLLGITGRPIVLF